MRTFLSFLAMCFLLAAPGARAQALPHEVTVNGVEFVLIPEGWFWYSVFAFDYSEHGDSRSRYRHAKVWLDNYYIAKFEARARDMERFMNAGAASAEAMTGYAEYVKVMSDGEAKPGDELCTVVRKSDGRYARTEPNRDLPATNLSWMLADEFARWMGFRLPTEAEWEKAARGTDKRFWPWGDQYADDTRAVVGWTSACDPSPVDSYPKGRSPYGVHHMAGNAGEYVADWYNQKFDDAMQDGVRNPVPATMGSAVPVDNPLKIVKGGRWSLDAAASTIASRMLVRLHGSSSREGARFALDAATVQKHIENGTAVVTRQ